MRGVTVTLTLLFLPLMLEAQSLNLPDAPGKAAMRKVCGSCHGAELVIGRKEARETWATVVDDMIQRGATGTDDEFFEVVDYLASIGVPLDEKDSRGRTPIQIGDIFPFDKPIQRMAEIILSRGGTPLYYPKEFVKPQ